MGLIKNVSGWSHDGFFNYLSVNPTRDEVTHYKVDPENDSDDSIVRLNTIKNFGSITCLDYSQSDLGFVGVSEKNGVVKLFNILTDTEEIKRFDLQVTAKHQRAINTLSISSSGLIAIGLDRYKNDQSLQIWNANYQSTDSAIINPSFSYCFNENIVSLKFLDDTNILAASTKFLKEIDLRSPNPIYQHPTRLSYDIKVNPFNSWQFSSYGDDGSLAIWDRRKFVSGSKVMEYDKPQPLLMFEQLVVHGVTSRKHMNSCFRWSSMSAVEFATLHSGDMIKMWRLGTIPNLKHDVPTNGDLTSDEIDDIESLFVSTVHNVNTTFDRVVTFDYIPKTGGDMSFICMRQSGTVYRMGIEQGVSRVKFNNFNSFMSSNSIKSEIKELRTQNDSYFSFSNTFGTEIKNLSFEDLEASDDEYNNTLDDLSNNSLDNDEISISHGNSRCSSLTDEDQFLIKPELLLQNDISTIMMKRAALGYGLDPMTTVDMIDSSKPLRNNAYIRDTWRWMAIAKTAVDDGTMVSGDLDLGYEGILGIWNGLDGLSNQNRYKGGANFTEKQLNKELEKIIKLKAKKNNKTQDIASLSPFAKSEKSIQRKLCMIISGWDLSQADIEEKYTSLIKQNHYEKAACWAVFFGDVERAIGILSSAKKERLRLIATAIAGYLAYKEYPGNNPWREQCRRMSSELSDPYLRVIFAFIADNDWWDILYENSISLRERLGVALRFLNDSDLSRFLEHTASTVIENGELEGLILTGITPSGIDLLQSYVEKTSDIQTAAMISVFGCPRYFKDGRASEWVETYRSMLNSWRLFLVRAKFDVLRTKLSKNNQGRLTCQVRSRQLYIQCVKCKKNINKPMDKPGISRQNSITKSAIKKFGLTNTTLGETSLQKHSCPHCGAPFPRCAICLLPLGTSNLPIVIGGTVQSPNPDNIKMDYLHYKERRRLKLNEWFSFCLSCNHGMHAGHAEEWFEKHLICPVPGCSCHCNE